MSDNALEVENLSVELGGTRIVHDLTFSVPRGSALAVIGPNGAGKTVLFRALIGSLPYEGSVRWAPGTRIGYVPQKLDIERDLPLTGNDFLRAKAAVSGAREEDVQRALHAGEPRGTDRRASRSARSPAASSSACSSPSRSSGVPPSCCSTSPPPAWTSRARSGSTRRSTACRTSEHLTVLLISHELSVVYRFAETVLCLSRDPLASDRPTRCSPPSASRACTAPLFATTTTSEPTRDLSVLVLSIGMATAAGLVGCFAVMRRMTLASDAISHVALPGIGVAVAFHVHPLLGGVAALVAGTALVWGLESRTRISTETIIGVVFSTALALGSMLSTGEELIDALLGTPTALEPWELAAGLVGVAAVAGFVLSQRSQLVLAQVSTDMARTAGVAVARVELLYLIAFSLTVALGLRYLGVLLMGSLIIIPAATAKVVARSLDEMLAVAVGCAVVSTLLGEFIAIRIDRPTGPVIITISAALFFLSLPLRRAR